MPLTLNLRYKSSPQEDLIGNIVVQVQKETHNPCFFFSVPEAEIKIETPRGAGPRQLRGRGTGWPSPLPSHNVTDICSCCDPKHIATGKSF